MKMVVLLNFDYKNKIKKKSTVTNMHIHTPQVVWVLGGHADPQCIQDTLGVGEAERGRWYFLSHCLSLRGRERISEFIGCTTT